MSAKAVDRYYRLKAAQQHFQAMPKDLSHQEREWLEQTVARQKEVENLILQSADLAKIDISDFQVEQAMKDVRNNYDSKEAFKKALGGVGLSTLELKDVLRKQLTVDFLLDQCSADVVRVSEQEARYFYDHYPDKFTKPEQRQARHLLITINDDYAENSRETVNNRIAEFRQQIVKGRDSFDALASRYSECPSALNGGELGWVSAGQLYPELDDALFNLAAGECSPVLETELGLHIVLCEDIRQESVIPFEQVVDNIQDKLSDMAKRKQQRKWLLSLESGNSVSSSVVLR